MHPLRWAQIVYLKAAKALTKISSEYTNFGDIFLPKLIIKLPKDKGINDYAIELVDN